MCVSMAHVKPAGPLALMAALGLIKGLSGLGFFEVHLTGRPGCCSEGHQATLSAECCLCADPLLTCRASAAPHVRCLCADPLLTCKASAARLVRCLCAGRACLPPAGSTAWLTGLPKSGLAHVCVHIPSTGARDLLLRSSHLCVCAPAMTVAPGACQAQAPGISD